MSLLLFIVSSLVFLASIPALFLGLIIPRVYARFFTKGVTRWKIIRSLGAIMLASIITALVTVEPVEPTQSEISQTEDTAIVENLAETVSNDQDEKETNEVTDEPASGAVAVVKVVDGDTITVSINGESETIRIIGINTPETVDPRKPVECFGQEASTKARELLDGQSVRLEIDASQGETDKYDRLLRYVFLSDGSDFGKLMISEGYAYEYTYQAPYQYQVAYKTAQGEAQSAKRGLWADNACNAISSDSGASNSATSEVTTTETPLSPSTSLLDSTTSSSIIDNAETQPVEPEVTVSEPTSAATTSSCSCASNSYNCGNFSTHSEAQSVYECCMVQVGYDVHNLDSDDDGSACESLP
ncbi:MAG: thermonuclease family protein [Patescibacteria group bacterium]